MAGVPGAGKTHFAKQFADMFSAPFIDHEKLVKISKSQASANEYGWELLSELVKTKQTIVAEGLADKYTDRTELVKFAAKNGYKVLFVLVQSAPAVAKQRSLKTLAIDEYERAFKRFSPIKPQELHIVISGQHTYNTQAKTVLRQLSEHRPELAEVHREKQNRIRVS